MALVLKDRVKETSTIVGTGSLTLLGASTGYQTFSSAIGNTNTTYYTIQSYNSSEWEIGIGTVSAGSLSRDTVLASSTGAKVSFSAGTKDVFCTYPASKSVYADASGYVSGYTIENSTIGNTTPNTGKFTSVTTPSVTATTTDLTLSAISTGAVKFNTLNGQGLQLSELSGGAVTTGLGIFSGTASQNSVYLTPFGSGASSNLILASKSVGSIFLQTNTNNNSVGTTQQVVSHTASAVNYVQVTGGATGSGVTIIPAGSDANILLALNSKGSNPIQFYTGGLRQAQVSHTASAVNFLQLTGSVAASALPLSAQGSDTNISMAFQPKGTGAIDLAAGSSGVNISNGGTVTAITRTGTGSGYTSIPSVAITAPTTAGGVQATASANMFVFSVTVASGGTGYTVGDVLSLVGGTGAAGQVTVATVSAGVITSITNGPSNGLYSALPTTPASVTGGTGSSATINITGYGVSTFTITNAGSGYIEQPTITFSGGGGSGASAYATVGSNPQLRSIGSNLDMFVANGQVFRFGNTGNTTVNWYRVQGSVSGGGVQLYAEGSDTNIPVLFSSKGTSNLSFYTNTLGQEQLRLAHTASAVNYVQVTGASTGNRPVISAQGSDTNIGLLFAAKGTTGATVFLGSGGSTNQFVISNNGAGTNFLQTASSATTAAPTLSAQGSDTNIDLALTPKGTGGVAINSAIKLGAGLDAGTSGQVLTSAGSGASPTWSSASGGGMTLLGTITLSGTGNQFSLGSLTLTSYKQLYVAFNAVGAGATAQKLSFTNTTGDQTSITNAAIATLSTNTNIGLGFGGFIVDLVSGILVTSTIFVSATGISAPVPIGTTVVSGSGQTGLAGTQTGIGTAATTIYVYVAGAGTKTGTITIYGIK